MSKQSKREVRGKSVEGEWGNEIGIRRVPHYQIGCGYLTCGFRDWNSEQHDKSHCSNCCSSKSKGRPNIKSIGKVCCDITWNHRNNIRSNRKQLGPFSSISQIPQDSG
jgi:hypothetical protein